MTVPHEFARERLDHAVSELLPQYSRSQIQVWIRTGELTVDGRQAKPSLLVAGGERILVASMTVELKDEPEPIAIDIVHEDADILILNKEAGLVVHPGAGNRVGTLLNGLLYHCPSLAQLPRAGIVHRLDKNTSGLMVVAKNSSSQNHLTKQLVSRTARRIYQAIVYGVPPAEGKVAEPVGRHRIHRVKMAVVPDGKEAATAFRRLRQLGEHALVECSLQTGRTHQIRVHMQHIGYPLVGDPTYGGHFRQPKSGSEHLLEVMGAFPRQALHAGELSIQHPGSGVSVSWQRQLPDDMQTLLAALEEEYGDA